MPPGRLVAALLTLVMMVGLVRPVRADVTAEQVRKALDRGVTYLKGQQNRERGNWAERPGQPGGMTSLCTLALLSAGVDPKDESIQKALAYLRRLGNPEMTYATALQTMVFCAAEPEKDLVYIRRNAAWLENIQLRGPDNPRRGSWAYSDRQGNGDNSNSQFALLALHEAHRVGVDVKDSTWTLARDHWLRNQLADGAWGYFENQPGTGSMTSAGIASLVITSGRLSTADARVEADRIRCCLALHESSEIERGVQWLARNFSVRINPPRAQLQRGIAGQERFWLYYYLYALERVGRMTGQRFIGAHDWYREGAEFLVGEQDSLTGQWSGVGHEENPLVATSFAMLFLSKGRWPVLISKLQHSTDGDWNQHRSDLNNLTRYVESRWQRDLTWQTIDIRRATAESLLETPVLWISGSATLRLSPEQKDHLRRYVQQGGFLFAEACCGGAEFDRSFRLLMEELFPDSPLRLLPADHPAWFAEERIPADQQRPLLGIDACCRTSVIYVPEDPRFPEPLSCLWELKHPLRAERYSPAVQQRIDAGAAIGANVLAYATGRQLKYKLEQDDFLFDDAADADRLRGTVSVVKLRHDGGSDDAPAALANLMRVVGQQTRIRTSASSELVGVTEERLAMHPIVFMHGRRQFRFTPTERKALATYLQRGGFLFADAICASPAFAQSFRDEMRAIFPDAPLKRLPENHPIFTSEFRGYDLTTVTLRDPQARLADDPLTARLTTVKPYLEGLELDGQLVVVFSPYDISCAMEASPSLECKGYVRADAAKIGVNVILYALQH